MSSSTLFETAFTFIFLAALPGRTTFLMLLMAARGRALPVFLGALLAFGIQGAISVGLGSVFSFLPPRVLQLGVGVLLLYFAKSFWWESRRATDLGEVKLNSTNPIWSAFLLIFAAEWGDVSQVAIASFSSRYQDRWMVFLGAVFALWLIAGIAVIAGKYLGRAISPTNIQRVAAIGFFVAGVYLMTRGLAGV